MSKRLTAVAIAGALILTACAEAEQQENGSTSTSEQNATTTVVTAAAAVGSEGVASIDPALQSSIDRAVADLAQRLEIPETEVAVNATELVAWSDSSLGCPDPDISYAQGPVDGALIKLAVGETSYSYHMGGSTYEPFLCEHSSGEEATVSPDPLDGTPLELDKPIEKYPDETVPPPGYDD